MPFYNEILHSQEGSSFINDKLNQHGLGSNSHVRLLL